MSSPLRETIRSAGFQYVQFHAKTGFHELRDAESGKTEFWFANKNHASYGLIYKNTHLEFAHSVN